MRFQKGIDSYIRDQLRRASISMVINIAEGSGKFSRADKRNNRWKEYIRAVVLGLVVDVDHVVSIRPEPQDDSSSRRVFCFQDYRLSDYRLSVTVTLVGDSNSGDRRRLPSLGDGNRGIRYTGQKTLFATDEPYNKSTTGN